MLTRMCKIEITYRFSGTVVTVLFRASGLRISYLNPGTGGPEYKIILLSSHRERQLYRIRNLHPPGHTLKREILRTAVKETTPYESIILRRAPFGCETCYFILRKPIEYEKCILWRTLKLQGE